MLYLAQLFSTEYYFQMSPGGSFPLGYLLVFFFGLQLFTRVLVFWLGPQNRHFRKACRGHLVPFDYLAPIGLILLLFRFAGMPFFSMRLWLFIVILLDIYYIGRAIVNIWQKYQARLATLERRKRRKYI